MSLRKLLAIRHCLGIEWKVVISQPCRWLLLMEKTSFQGWIDIPLHVEFLQTQIHFVLVNELISFPLCLFFFFRVAHKLLTTHTVLGAVHTAQSVYHSQVMLKINLQYCCSKLWQIVMCWHSHKLLVKKSNTSLFCHFMFETRDGHIMQSLRVCKLHKRLGFTKQAWLWKFFLLQLGMCLLPKRL